MASPACVGVNSRSRWWTGRPGSCDSWGRKDSDTTERLNWSVQKYATVGYWDQADCLKFRMIPQFLTLKSRGNKENFILLFRPYLPAFVVSFFQFLMWKNIVIYHTPVTRGRRIIISVSSKKPHILITYKKLYVKNEEQVIRYELYWMALSTCLTS